MEAGGAGVALGPLPPVQHPEVEGEPGLVQHGVVAERTPVKHIAGTAPCSVRPSPEHAPPASDLLGNRSHEQVTLAGTGPIT